jgi:diguanylate cyclase (GGDEF)-like protein
MRKRLEDLHKRFAGTLPERIRHLEECCVVFLANQSDTEEMENVVRAAHTLAGSAASFGFKDVSSAAKTLEATIKSWAEKTGNQGEKPEIRISVCIESLKSALIENNSSFDIKACCKAPEISHSLRPHEKVVFIVEENHLLIRNLSLQLRYFGYLVRSFNSLSELREGAKNIIPSVIIINMTFRGADSPEAQAIREIRNEFMSNVPVIFISGCADFDLRLQAVRAGAEAYFVKPLNITMLIDKLDSLTSGMTVEPYRILVIDDDAELSAYYSLMLTQAGMITEVANDLVKIVSHISEFNPDLILMDMYMPVCNGIELSKVIRQMDEFVSIPIVFLSSEMNIKKQLTAMGTGGDDFLTKPIKPEHLISSISQRAERMRIIRSFMNCDSLTGLLNHTKIKEQLDIAVEKARRRNGKLCFAMIDIDRFKTVNDTYGHPAGDRVIKSLSNLLRQRLRRTDIIGRYGGEEFAVILEDTEADKALIILDEIRANFSGIKHQSDGREFYSTFSCGIAAFPQCPDENFLASTADKALYEAKDSGRNRVILK